MMIGKQSVFLVFALSQLCLAEKTSIKMEEISGDKDTSIVIKKGTDTQTCLRYEVIKETEELTGDPDFQKGRALDSWKGACESWKKQMRELNKENQIISLHCGKPSLHKEEDRVTYDSKAVYQIRVKVQEKGM